MSDRYSQLVKLPVAGTVAKRIGLPQPVDARARRRVQRARAARRRGPRGRGGRARAGRDRAPTRRPRSTIPCARTPRPRGSTRPSSTRRRRPTGRSRRSCSTPPGSRTVTRGAAALLLSDRPARRAVRPGDRARRRAARAGGLHALARQGDRPRRDGQPRAGRAGRGTIGATLRFLLSPRSAYVSGQVVRVGRRARGPARRTHRAGHRRLARDRRRDRRESSSASGATVTRLDLQDADIELDITADDAPQVLAERFADGLDILVHNAGVTKDRTLAKMPEERWQSLMEVNLLAPERITAALPAQRRRADRLRLLAERDRGQRRPDELRDLQGRAARPRQRPASWSAGSRSTRSRPGFIETQMTAAMPIACARRGGG